MTILSRLGPRLGRSRPQVSRNSSTNLSSHTTHEHLTLHSHTPALHLHRGIPGGRRNFSIANNLEAAVYEATQLISALHVATGTPWYVTIPLAAVAVNAAVRLPIAIYSRRLEQKRARLSPLFWAWNARHAERVARDHQGQGGGPATNDPAKLRPLVRRRTAATERRIARDHGVQTWKIHYLGPVTALPFFLTAIQGVRRLCGAEGGVLGLFTNPLGLFRVWLEGGEGKGRGEAHAVAASADGGDAAGQDQLVAADTVAPVDGSSVAVAAPEVSQLPASTDLLGYEPSLSTGGCLWFPDLTVPDPTHTLPMVLSAVMLWVVLPRTMEQTRQLLDPTATDLSWRTRFHRSLIVLSLVIGPATWQLPAAMHLYWISSTLVATTQANLVRRIWKLPKNHDGPAQGRDLPVVLPPPP